MKVYLDNAASTKLHPEVLEVMIKFLQEGIGNASSTHSFGRTSKAIIERSRKTIAGHLNVSPLEIVFTSGGTESNNMALKNATSTFDIKHIITTAGEHKCVKETAQFLTADLKVKLHYVQLDNCGRVDTEQLKSLLQKLEGKKLVSLMHANNEIGTITDIKKIGEICAAHDAIFHSDTVQTLGLYKLDLSDINIHYCSGSAHKFGGPKGVGFLYMRSNAKIPPYIHGGGQEMSYRSGTENIAGIAAMAKAFDVSMKNVEKDSEIISALKEYTKERLIEKVDGVQFNGCQQNALTKVLSVSLPSRFNMDSFVFQLDMAGVAVTAGSACSSGASSGSYVLDAIGHDPKRKTIRVSFSADNTKEEIDYAVEQIVKIGSKVGITA